jgi:hypothetical protein
MASANGESEAKSTNPPTSSPALTEKYHNFKKLHDESYRLIENGIELEQGGQNQEVNIFSRQDLMIPIFRSKYFVHHISLSNLIARLLHHMKVD